uniref:Torsin-1B n=1 Tax=Ascaris suum TaxID=6253 RepID=F1LAK3_ASCSU
MDATGLRRTMRQRLYGQHLAQETVLPALQSHFNNENPKKALVISFHGWTGCGKNYLTSMIAENMFKKGMKSEYVHLFISTLHFANPNEIATYQQNLREWIHGNVSLCERSLFIFDEVDKMPPKVMDAIKPFIDHYDNLEGVDYRKSIFIFLSNSGGNEITEKTLRHYQAGKIRETLTLAQMEEVLISGAFNADGGLKMSELISTHLIDHFIPFLPLERRHILLCIRDYMNAYNFTPTDERVAEIADSLQYFPKANPIYSSSGCKRVAQKTELLISAEREREKQRLRRLSGDDDDML